MILFQVVKMKTWECGCIYKIHKGEKQLLIPWKGEGCLVNLRQKRVLFPEVYGYHYSKKRYQWKVVGSFKKQLIFMDDRSSLLLRQISDV